MAATLTIQPLTDDGLSIDMPLEQEHRDRAAATLSLITHLNAQGRGTCMTWLAEDSWSLTFLDGTTATAAIHSDLDHDDDASESDDAHPNLPRRDENPVDPTAPIPHAESTDTLRQRAEEARQSWLDARSEEAAVRASADSGMGDVFDASNYTDSCRGYYLRVRLTHIAALPNP